MVKEPGREGDFPVHQDWTYVDEEKYSSYAFWIPLNDVDESNGALHIVKGSHRFHNALRGPYVHEPFASLSEVIKDKYSEVVRLRAGEALVWDHRLIHFSKSNITPSTRLAFTLIMVPENAEVIHCYGRPESGGTIIDKLKADTEFYMKYKIGSSPDFAPLLETIVQPAVSFDEIGLNELKKNYRI
jgi:ectoine hydroxylase-related dioxygenase (phytanoyl-CoA dioxygenase family)